MSDTTVLSTATLAADPMGTRKRGDTIAILCVSPILIWQLQNPYSASALRLIFVGMLLLGLIRSSAVFLLILIQLDLFLTTSVSGTNTEPPGLMIAFCCVILLMLLSRLRSSQELTGVRSIAQLLAGALKTLSQPAEQPFSPHEEETNDAVGSEILGIAIRGLILVLSAGLLLITFPIDPSSVQEYGLTPAGMRTLSIGLVLVAAYLVVTLPLSEVQWKRLTPDQAGIYLRSRFIGWLHRDLRAVERHRRRLRLKGARKLRRTQQNTFSSYPKKAL